MEFDPEGFQAAVMKWTGHNFPRAQKHQPLLGIMEEIGELVEALEKSRGKPGDAVVLSPEVEDAVGDTMVFLAHFSGMNGFSLIQCSAKQRDRFAMMLHPQLNIRNELMKAVGKLAHAYLKDEQGIRRNEKHRDNMMEQIGCIVDLLSQLCGNEGQGLLDATAKAWNEVKDRDWVKYPKTGRPEKHPATELADTIEALMPPMEHFMPQKTSSWSVKAAPKAPAKPAANPCGKPGYKMPDRIPKDKWSEEVPF